MKRCLGFGLSIVLFGAFFHGETASALPKNCKNCETEIPFPWGVEVPFPLSELEGSWLMEWNGTPVQLDFRIVSIGVGDRANLEIVIANRTTREIYAHGSGLNLKHGRSVTLIVMDRNGDLHRMTVQNFEKKDGDHVAKVTVLTDTILGQPPTRDRRAVLYKVQLPPIRVPKAR